MSKSLPASVLSLAQLLEQQSPAPPLLDRHRRITPIAETDPSSGKSGIWTLVRPAKAGMFSGRQSHRGRSQEPRNLDRIRGGNEADEADRPSHPWDGE